MENTTFQCTLFMHVLKTWQKKLKKKNCATGKINSDVVLDFYANGISSSFKIIGSKKNTHRTLVTWNANHMSRSCYAIRIVT